MPHGLFLPKGPGSAAVITKGDKAKSQEPGSLKVSWTTILATDCLLWDSLWCEIKKPLPCLNHHWLGLLLLLAACITNWLKEKFNLAISMTVVFIFQICGGQSPRWPTMIPASFTPLCSPLPQSARVAATALWHGKNYKFNNNFKIIYIYFLWMSHFSFYIWHVFWSIIYPFLKLENKENLKK